MILGGYVIIPIVCVMILSGTNLVTDPFTVGDPRRIPLQDMGVSQLVAHDLFDVKRGDDMTPESAVDLEHGMSDLAASALLPGYAFAQVQGSSPTDGAFDVSEAVFIGSTLFRSQETLPTGMAFSNDGLKMFVVGTSSDNINEYTLSDAFDVPTATFVDAFSVSSRENAPTGMAFSNDGLKMFVVGFKGNDINEYELSAPFDVSTSEFVRAKTIRQQETSPTGMAFSNDGLKMFVVGFSSSSINEYALSAPFTLSGRSFVNATSVSTQVANPSDISFSNDGLKMFVVDGHEFGKIHEYTLSAPFGVSTATHADSLSVAFQESFPRGMAFSNDGLRMFVVGNNGDDVNEYALNSAYLAEQGIPRLESIERYSPASQDTVSPTLVYRVTFSEDVTGVTASDFALAPYSPKGTGASPVTGVSGSGDTYYVTVSTFTSGAYNLDLVSSGHGIADTEGNPLTNTFPTGADESYAVIIDIVNPTLESIELYNPAYRPTDSQTLVYRATFSESVTGVTASDFALSPDSTGGVETTTGKFMQARSPNLAIPNLQTVSDAITVSDSGTATSVSVAVDITHTYIGDLTIVLIAPDGTSEILHNGIGDDTDDIDTTYIQYFEGTPISGVWTLRINDAYETYSGVLNSWKLTINYDNPATTASLVTGVSGSGNTYHVTVSAPTDGTYNLDLVSSGHGIKDTANNQLIDTAPTGEDETYAVSAQAIDATRPTLESIERHSPASQDTDSQTLVYSVTFSEDVMGVTASDFALSPGSTGGTGTSPVTGVSGSGYTYYVTVSATTDGTYNLDLVSSGHGIVDIANNQLIDTAPTGADETYAVSAQAIDATSPELESIERHSPASQDTNSQTLVYSVTFSEDVTGVTASDFALSPDSTGGTGSGTGSGSGTGQFTQTRSPNLAIPDLQTVSDAIAVSDSGTVTSVSVDIVITHEYIGDLTIDLIAPDGTTRTLHDRFGGTINNINKTYAPPFGSIPISGTWTLRISDNYDADPGVLNSWMLTINYGDASTSASPVTGVSGSDYTYHVTVSATTDGTYNLDLVSSGHGIADTAGNPLTNTAPTGADETYAVSTQAIDATRPTLESIERHSPASQDTNSQTLVYSVTFSEDVTGVTASDFALSPDSTGGTGASPVTGVSGSGDAYHVTVSATADGTYNLDLVSSGHGIADMANNQLTDTAPTGADETYAVSTAVIDDASPELESIERHNPASQDTDSQTLVYSVTFSEDVTGVTASDFALSPDSTGGTGSGTGSGSGTGQFTQTRSPNLAIPDLQTVSDAIAVSDSGTATSVSVDIVITHEYIGDLKIDLIAPDGTTRTLHDNSGGSINNINKTYAPPFGSIPISGNWTLRINDNYDADPGVLNSWMLTINYGDASTSASPVTGVSGSDYTYHVTVSATTDGTYNLDLVSSGHGIADMANNQLTDTAPTGADETYAVSTQAIDDASPELESIERHNPASQDTNSQTLVYSVTFSEDVTGVTASDFALSPDSTGGTGASPVTGVSGSGDAYHVTVSATTDGTYNLDLVSSGHGIADMANNQLTDTAPTGADETYAVSTAVIDDASPELESIERHSPASQDTDSQTLVYSVTFSEDVTGVTASDFALSPDSTGGTGASPVTGQFTQTRSPNLAIPDLQTVSDAIAVSDSGTATSVSVDIVITHEYIGDLKIDLIAPDGTTRTLHDRFGGSINNINKTYAPPFGSIPISGNWTLRINDNYDADPGVLNSWMLTINYGDASTSASPVTGVSGSGDAYHVTVSATADGTYNLDLVSSGHGIADMANNQLTDTAPTGADETYAVSTQAIDDASPELESIERHNPASQDTNSQTLVYSVTFSEDVTGVTASDFALSPDSTGGTGASPVTGVSGSGDAYHVTVSATADGTYNLDLVSSGHGIADMANNQLTDTAPTGADETYAVSTAVIDDASPELESIERHNPASQDTNSQTLVYSVTFSEDVTGVTASDFALSPDSTGGTGSGTGSGSGTGQFTQTRSPNLAIPDLQTVSDAIAVSDSGNATSVSVDIVITHEYIGDLKIDLIAPDGTTRTLHDNSGGSINNINKTYAPPFGSIPISGNWTLRINDNYDADPGVLNSWMLTINYGDASTSASPVTGVSGSDYTYHVTVSATTDGTYNLDLVSSGHGIADMANNQLTDTAPTGADETYAVSTQAIDDASPELESIERHNPASQDTNSQTLVYSVTFSEDVTGVTASDFALSPDSTGGTGSGTGQFTQTRSPNLAIPDLQTVSDAIAVSDSGTATSVSVDIDITHEYIGDLTIDLIAPDGTTRTLHANSGGSTNNINKTYAPPFGSIPISGNWTLRINDNYEVDPGVLNSWMLTINYGDASTSASPVTGVSGSGDAYHVTVSATTDGTYNLDLVSSGHGIADTAGNPLTDTAPTGADETYAVSTQAIDDASPELESIERHNPASQDTNSQTLVYQATFSENVAGVDRTDFVLSPGSTGTGNVTGVTGSDSQYLVTVSAARNGTYNLDIAPGSGIVDAAANPLSGTIPTGEDQSYTVRTSAVHDVPANTLPLVNAGPDQTVLEGSPVTLNGTASDPDGNALTYSWSHGSAPAIEFANSTARSTTFTAPWVGSNSTVTLTLTADDGTGSASDSMSVTIVNTPQPPRNIGGISLSSTESGVIEAVWDAPGETPADYRISWAKTGESFRTWTDVSGNAFPTGASHTISDLEEGEEYKVKVRARYGSSSGLWSDASTVTVAGTG